MGTDILAMIDALLGKRCRIETTDGCITYQTIHHVGYRQIDYGGHGEVPYPVTLYYDEREAEGADLAILAKISIDE